MYCSCGKIVENKDTGLCSSCSRIVRKQLTDSRKQTDKRKMLLSKPKKIYAKPNKVSEKRKVLNAEYAILREQYLKDHPECEIKLQVCTRTSTQIHHTASGTNKATNLNNVKTWKASCDMCNQFLHDKLSAKEAREKGLKI